MLIPFYFLSKPIIDSRHIFLTVPQTISVHDALEHGMGGAFLFFFFPSFMPDPPANF